MSPLSTVFVACYLVLLVPFVMEGSWFTAATTVHAYVFNAITHAKCYCYNINNNYYDSIQNNKLTYNYPAQL